jgi:heterodisulfide reductase subunit A
MAKPKTARKARTKRTKKKETEPAALVIGAGVGGMRAALDIAESGHRVYLLDRSPRVGGTASQLDKWFPTDDCSLCKLLPPLYTRDAGEFCLRRTLIHPNIEILTSSELARVEGEAGDFTVTVVRSPQLIDRAKCIGCDKCVEVCPVEVADEFNEGLVKRKAVYLSHPNAVPNNYVIDTETCTKCGECVKVCPTNAINLENKQDELVLGVGAIVADPGFKSFGPSELQEFGHGRYENVLTNTELERMLSGTGRAPLKSPPGSVGFFQCVGSRDEKRPYCSSACCMYAIKEANLLKEKYPDCDVTVFFMDMRAFGKSYHRYYLRAIKNGVRFVRSRVPAVDGVSEEGKLSVLYEDESGNLRRENFDMVVLSVGQTEPASTLELAEKLGIDLNPYGFCGGLPFDQVATSKDGIFVCGSFSSPADIPDTVIRASGAASRALGLLPAAAEEKEPSSAEEGDVEPSVGVVLCSCGEDIAKVIDIEKLSEEAKGIPYVELVDTSNFLCVPEGLKRLEALIRDGGVNRVVIAACSAHPYEGLFRKVASAAGLDPDMLAVLNIREQLSWVHERSDEAIRKALALLEGAVDRIAAQKSYPAKRQEVIKKAVVIGGGIAGLTSAIDLAERGFSVELLEKSDKLGGRLVEKPQTYEGDGLSSLLQDKIKRAEKNRKVKIRLGSQVDSIEGTAGNFAVGVVTDGKRERIAGGAVILAVGAEEYRPDEFGFGASERVFALSDFEKELYKDDSDILKAKSFAFITCVGSRTEKRPFCSRVCCSETVFAALKLKDHNPDADIYVIYRDIMTYGFNEELYRKARDAGVIFIRYELEDPPSVELADTGPRVIVNDILLGERFSIRADYVVLAFGMDPMPGGRLASALKLDLTEDGFLKEVNVKFRPLDLARDGIFLSGTAHSPMSVSEAITSGHAAAARAGTLLSKNYLVGRTAVAEVNRRRCSACELCITACPFEARYMDYDEMVACVSEHICQGCGTCAAVCPNGASKLRRFEEKDIFAILETLTR